MKKLVFILLTFVFINSAYADIEIHRKDLELSNKTKSVPVVFFYRQKVDIQVLYANDSTIGFVLNGSTKAKSEKEYFTNLTTFIRWFLKNYRVKKIKQKYIAFVLNSDFNNYPVFQISTNNLRLLDNRDFADKDLMAFNKKGGLVYPLKVILRRGDFIKNGDKIKTTKKHYDIFLNKFDISPLIEGTIEAWYKNKKIKK